MRSIYLGLMMALIVSPAMAETVFLKDGRIVEGKILEKTDKGVKVDVNGTAMTYYADEIKTVDGQPLPKPVLPVPAYIAEANSNTPAVVDSAKRELIVKFIEVFGTKAAMIQNLGNMMKSLPADDPQSQRLKDSIKVDEILERLVPVYDKQFSEEELQKFIDFYSSPAGRKLLQGIPVIMQKSVQVSAEYFQEKFPELKAK